MTCRDRIKIDNSAYINESVNGGVEGCPDWYGYLPRPDYCSDKMRLSCGDRALCVQCWDREIPEQGASEGIIAGMNYTHPEITKSVEQLVKEAKAKADEFLGILDSGNRTEFESGAVRDMREGKGRCDLMPLEVVARHCAEDGNAYDNVILNIRYFQKTNNTSYLYNALEFFNERHWDCVYTMFLEVAKHFEDGAKKYGENNWQKGMPVHCYIDSAVRHYLKWLRGDKDEPHDRAFVWNIMCCIWEVDYRTEDSEEKKEN